MNNFALPTSQLSRWVQLLGWWLRTKEQQQTTQPVVTQAEIQSRHLAFHRAYQRFAQQQPAWVARRFDADLLHQVVDTTELPTALALAAAWDRQFGPVSPMPVRCQQLAALAVVANVFLALYRDEVCTIVQSR
jgi:hypothetical protein